MCNAVEALSKVLQDNLLLQIAMKPVLLKDVRRGEYFTLTDKVKYNEDGEVLSKYVYIRSDYDREIKKYEVYKNDDMNDCRFMKGTRIVWIDFIF